MDAREERGLVIAATSKIEKNQLGMWKVPSQSGNGTSYVVNLDHGHPFCSCPDFEKGNVCKHIHAVEYVVKRETKADGTETLTQSVKVTCTQEWHDYDDAQMHEEERFVILLRDLCNGIPQPPQTFGRPRLPLADVRLKCEAGICSTYRVDATSSYCPCARSSIGLEHCPCEAFGCGFKSHRA